MKKLFALTLLFSFFGAVQLAAMDLILKEFEGCSTKVALHELEHHSPQKKKKITAKGRRQPPLDNFVAHQGKKNLQKIEIKKERAKRALEKIALALGHNEKQNS